MSWSDYAGLAALLLLWVVFLKLERAYLLEHGAPCEQMGCPNRVPAHMDRVYRWITVVRCPSFCASCAWKEGLPLANPTARCEGECCDHDH